MEYNPKSARQWSRLGPRAVYGMAILDLMNKNEQVYALSADLGASSGLRRVMTCFPDRYFNVGIAEQNLIGVSAGFAKEGLIPFASSFAPFITLRCADQVRMNLGYMHLNVKTVGLGSGLSMSILGNSHYGNEDLAFMRSIPEMTILSPADCGQLTQIVDAAASFEGPVYIRLTGEAGMPVVYQEPTDFKIGKSYVFSEGRDVTFIATGSMVTYALKAAEQLREHGLSVGVVDMHTIKPLDTDCLEKLAKSTSLIVTAEEHGLVGGMGSAIAEYLCQSGYQTKLQMFGVPDRYLVAGDYSYMLNQAGLTAEHFTDEVLSKLGMK